MTRTLLPSGLFLLLGAGVSAAAHMLRLGLAAGALAVGSVLAAALLFYPIHRVLSGRILGFAEAVVRSKLETAMVLGAAIAQRDSDTGAHTFRVSLYAVRLAAVLGSPELDMIVLVLGAVLHDVGKIGIRDSILLKTGPLDEAEMAVMRTHVQLGLDIIDASSWLQRARPVVGCHHERFDGKGYPRGLKGRDIPLEARVFAIADVFDALTSHRPYCQPVTFKEAMAHVEREAGGHFDPVLVAAFRRIAEVAHRELSQASEAELKTLLMAEVNRHRAALYAPETFPSRLPAQPLPAVAIVTGSDEEESS